MRLENIELENFRAIGSAKLELQGKSTVIFGINGTGKSSILRAVNLLYANIINQVVNRKELKQKYKLTFLWYNLDAIFCYYSGERSLKS